MRSQLNGLKSLIDAVPGLTDVVIDGVVTVAAGDPATVSATMTGTVLHLSFGIPQGFQGIQGDQGAPGNPGSDGPQGPQGPPFANAVVDSVTTLPAGSAATVDVSFDGSNVHFSFGIPVGFDGAPGAPGEVSLAELDAAIQGTSANTNAVTTLNLAVSEPPTKAEVQAIADKIDELVMALRRM